MNPFAYFLELSIFGKSLMLLAFIVITYFGIIRSGLSLAPWVPTHKRDLKRLDRLCNLQPGETYVEAGCGNALVTKYIAKHNPQVTCVGIEYSSIMIVWAKMVAVFSRLPNLKIVYGNALEYDFNDADVVYTYGLPKTVNQKLLPKVKTEQKPGGRFISYAFEINGVNVIKDESDTSSNIYVYQQPV